MSEKEFFEPHREPVEIRTRIRDGKSRWNVRNLFLLAIVAFSGLIFTNRIISLAPEVNEREDRSKIYLKALETNLAGNWTQKYTSEAHLPGTNYGFVEWTKNKFEEYGFKTCIDSYDVYVSYPFQHDLKLLDAKGKHTLYEAPLREDELDEDKTSKGKDLVPTFLSYSANGNVTAQYVYVNYGTREDFATLDSSGVSVKGKIVIARYGHIMRGLKVKFAQENGAIGVLLYSDPGNDYGITPANGYKQYPHGPARHESAVERGSVQFLGGVGAAPGDPTTPGYASKPGVERKDPHNSIGKIPALPISYREVRPILEKLNGYGSNISDEKWRGELEGFDYSTGPNPEVKLNLYNNQIYNISQLHNVYGEIEGENKDEVIIIGNHRDAWVKGGAGDPNSGSAALLEVARGLGELKKSGYKFKRTIILQSFDGEEYGLLGSTEFGEYAAKELKRKVVAYLNVDVAVVGRDLKMGASPVLNHILRKVAKTLSYPGEKSGSLYDHFVQKAGDKIRNLGSGSDYTVFLEHLGIPSVDMSFAQSKGDPIYQYHSNYDSYHWMEKFGDKGFVFHNLLAKYLGLVALELNERHLIDFKLEDYSKDLLKYYNETADLIPKKWLHKHIVNKDTWDDYLKYDLQNERSVFDDSYSYYSLKTLYPFPELLAPTQCKHNKVHTMYDSKHHRNATLQELVGKTYEDLLNLENKATIFDAETDNLQIKYDRRDSLHWWQRIKLHFQIKKHNKLLQYFERNFLYHKGLDKRSWFKHIVFASGRYTGYAGQTFPGLKEAIEDGEIDNLVRWLGIVSKSIRRVSTQLSL